MNPELHYLHAHTFLYDGKFQEAEEAIRRAIGAKEAGGKCNVDIAEFASRIERFKSFAQQEAPVESFLKKVPVGELLEFAQANESTGRSEIALAGLPVHHRHADYRLSEKW